MDNIDAHPLRYAKLTKAIERVLSKRAIEKRLDGETLATAIEIAEVIVGTNRLRS